LHLSFLVVDVFSEVFAVFFRKKIQQFLNSDDGLQLDFVRFLAGYLPQRSEKFDFDFHLFSIPIFRGGIYSILCPIFFALGRAGNLAGFGSIKLK